MKVTVRKNSEEKDVEMHLYLEDRGSSVALRGIDGAGKDWTIALIDDAGLTRAGSIGVHSGWPLDERGRIVLDEP